jgi:hypothetical protein
MHFRLAKPRWMGDEWKHPFRHSSRKGAAMETTVGFVTTDDDAGPLILMTLITNEGGAMPDREVVKVPIGVNEVLEIAAALEPYSGDVARELRGMMEHVKAETVAQMGRLRELAEEAKDRIARWA